MDFLIAMLTHFLKSIATHMAKDFWKLIKKRNKKATFT